MKKEQYEHTEQYERAELEVIRFETEDIVTTSVQRFLDEYEDDILKQK
ncbi:MAG: hypothetical protein Q4F51_00925 [Sarcina sp.]|nr:hypothetical protein [Sarcina sp.]